MPINRIRQIRESQGLSQAEVADRAGIPRSNWHYAENPETSPRLPQLLKISKALGVPIEALIVEERSVQPPLGGLEGAFIAEMRRRRELKGTSQ